MGYLTSGMIDETAEKGVADPQKAHALAYNLFSLSILFWAACCFFWVLMAYKIDPKQSSKKEYNKLGQREKNDGTDIAPSIQLLRNA